jgi:hypothetical protein
VRSPVPLASRDRVEACSHAHEVAHRVREFVSEQPDTGVVQTWYGQKDQVGQCVRVNDDSKQLMCLAGLDARFRYVR